MIKRLDQCAGKSILGTNADPYPLSAWVANGVRVRHQIQMFLVGCDSTSIMYDLESDCDWTHDAPQPTGGPFDVSLPITAAGSYSLQIVQTSESQFSGGAFQSDLEDCLSVSFSIDAIAITRPLEDGISV